MNAVTFNEPFTPYFESISKKSPLSSPLLIWGGERYDGRTVAQCTNERDCVAEQFTSSDGIIRTPFTECRIYSRDAHDSHCEERTIIFPDKIYHLGIEKKCNHVVTWCKDRELQEGWEGLFVTKFFDCEGTRFKSTRCWFYLKDRTTRQYSEQIDIEVWKKRHKDCSEGFSLGLAVFISTLQLSIDFSNPHFFLCKKSPTIPQGKSIVWQKQREHYVLLHKSHPANKIESHGKVIENGEPQILRSAHCRRAHFRLLKSPKFRYKVGQKVWVRSTWVGPKEWKDHSGQIYTIIEPPKQQIQI